MSRNKMTAEEAREFDAQFNWRDLPPVTNPIIHNYRCLAKLFWILFIGTGAIILAIIVFPLLKIFVHPKEKFRNKAQRFVSAGFRFFMKLLDVSGIVKILIDKETKEKLFNLHSKIVVANHPSILDTVIMITLIPNATVIASQKYEHGPLGGVIRACYIINSLDFDELCDRCRETLSYGSNVIIFPEGTRTPRHGHNQYKKGAARIARATKSDILPFFLGGSDKFGLGKNNPFWSFNTVEPLIYHVVPLGEICIDDYMDLTDPISAKRITNEIHDRIMTKAEEYKKDHPYTRTVNNV
ncbi:MAG: 1-acyl-sn-glycerol-3-phosphate acyltransferase [Treponema sp.]|nr:1-acyl-sn-glycerol-3-phosphate acyltransferase [Candidatus Treponema equi]